MCLGPTLTCRLGKGCVVEAEPEPVQLVQCPELAGEWRPVDNALWTRPHQANHSYTVERFDDWGRNAYVTGGEVLELALLLLLLFLPLPLPLPGLIPGNDDQTRIAVLFASSPSPPVHRVRSSSAAGEFLAEHPKRRRLLCA